MRDINKSKGRRVRTGWFWPLVLIALPMCTNDFDRLLEGDDRDRNPLPAFDPGDSPTSAVMCDIPKVPPEGGNCADSAEVGVLMSKAHAAIALNEGDSSSVVLDFSDLAACGGLPRKVEYFGPFPDGRRVCVTCDDQGPTTYAGVAAVCVAKCKDLINLDISLGGPQPAEGIDAYCAAKAQVSTNFDKDHCATNACTSNGNSDPNYNDPRRDPEDLIWMDAPSDPDDNTLTFPGPAADGGAFSGGGASQQLITTGDAWVEFAAGQPGVSHVLGVRESCPDVTVCPDEDGTLGDITVALSLNFNNLVYVVNQHAEVLDGPFDPPYTPGERFRMYVVDRNDKKAEISFWRFEESCSVSVPPPCKLYTHPELLSYPLRVDATFREAGASLHNVTIMRIIQ